MTGRQDSGGSTVRRLQLGARLRELRLAKGVSREDAGYRIRASESKISRMELGRVSFKPRDITDLLHLYGVEDQEEHDRLLELTREANSPGWWRTYGDVLDSWFTNYLDLEQSAELIRTYEIQFVPGLLQTEAYASAVIRLGHQGPGTVEIERRAKLRMARKQILTRPDAPKLWAVLDEAVLRRLIGGREVMHEQIVSLIEATENPNIRLQIIPFDSGGHAAAGGAFSILRFPHEELDDVVYIEHLTSAVYLDKHDDLDNYATAFSRLIIDAAPPDETPQILRKIADDVAFDHKETEI
ncbi:helix-turn-helix domain-containing protein [Paractinoplanes atraurantiacus]|uniref:Helix-turn-helix domain-containing protein n=1 Tax=Paractinoplanes atraurantiacus TaxID=1036182 RepID=A0A285KIB0_9ACTN|nr:helix-turn-helix transcriptional regulator [Actinoplanes atraurantiacus]SNY71637.1 Helix-turn-helix domain-containing protein [Actinoplanes atraurantiacus]